jgi:hypothetical protein
MNGKTEVVSRDGWTCTLEECKKLIKVGETRWYELIDPDKKKWITGCCLEHFEKQGGKVAEFKPRGNYSPPRTTEQKVADVKAFDEFYKTIESELLPETEVVESVGKTTKKRVKSNVRLSLDYCQILASVFNGATK